MRIPIAILFILAAMGNALAKDQDAADCAKIDDSLKRLNCYDGYFRTGGSHTDATRDNEKPLSFVDFVTDFDDLVGQQVSVRGFGLMLGESLVLYQEMGSLSGAFINIEKLSRSNKREVLSRCSSGCNVVVTGIARRIMMQQSIIATFVSVGG